MNTILLIPTKNEDWILDFTLSSLHEHVDYILIADQHSTDTTLEICKKYPKVTVIENTETGHSNKVRWLLLDEARKVEGDNLIICIDADEIISAHTIATLKEKSAENGIGSTFSLPWIQLWKNTHEHRVDGVWKDNVKAIAFFDNRRMDYERTLVINDHTSRIPTIDAGKNILLKDNPLFHIHFLAWKRAQIKQVWYRCSELISSPKKARYINNKYSVSDDSNTVISQPIPRNWLLGISFPNNSVYEKEDTLRIQQIYTWFNTYKTSYFEPLDIWNIPEFKELFIKENHREPRVLHYPKILVELNKMRHWIKNIIK